jgi:DNA-binding NtrC family response regulator
MLRLFSSALESAGWNKARAARELRWSRMTLYRKMARYEVAGGAGRKRNAGIATALRGATA